jgi:hypothetical protein
MWLCAACGLAQLVAGPTVPEEPKGREPAALVDQATDAVRRVAEAGLLVTGGRVLECASPHGGSWLGLLGAQGLVPVGDDGPADIVVDCFGMMHAPDQNAAVAERIERVAPGGVLLLQYHGLDAIVRCGQWNALRHGHYAYYSTTALTAMLDAHGFRPRRVWHFDLYGGTVLVAATAKDDRRPWDEASVHAALAADARAGVTDPRTVGGLQRQSSSHAEALRTWLEDERRAGRAVVGYGAASRAGALLVRAGVDRSLLPAIVDASPAKHGLRMPGTDIPVVDPSRLASPGSISVLLFVPDLLAEVRASFAGVEESGGRWVDAEGLAS